MIRATYIALLLLTALLAAGCSTDYEIATGYDSRRTGASTEQAAVTTTDSAAPSSDTPGAPSTSGPSGETARPSLAEETELELPGEPPPAPSPPGPALAPLRPAPKARPEPLAARPEPSQPPSEPAAPRNLVIQLSTGVALAQTLPTGTAMGFSVDYVVVGGQPGPSPYAWVITPSRGQPVKQPVQLNLRGTLQGFVLQFRPEHGPFKTHIEDAHGNRVSASLDLR